MTEMSEVILAWITPIDAAMPTALRQSEPWGTAMVKSLETGQKHERERLAIIMDHLWGTALPLVQPLADRSGFGAAWRTMTTERTAAARAALQAVASGLPSLVAQNMTAALHLADAGDAGEAAKAAGQAVVLVGVAAMRGAATEEEWRAAATGNEAMKAAGEAAKAEAWDAIDPCGLLERLVEVDPQLGASGRAKKPLQNWLEEQAAAHLAEERRRAGDGMKFGFGLLLLLALAIALINLLYR